MRLVRRFKTFEATFERRLKPETESYNHRVYLTLSFYLRSRNAFACVKSRSLRREASQAFAD